jgi:Fe2+ transport system protein FeoA
MNATQNARLSSLRPGEVAEIVSVDTDDPALRNRLTALGFAPRTAIVAIRRAPMGDPTEFEIRGARIALRRTESSQITIVQVVR